MALALCDTLLLIAHADLEHPLPWEISMEIEQVLNPNPFTEIFVQCMCCGTK